MKKLKKLSLILIIIGTIFIFIGCVGNKMQRDEYEQKSHNNSSFTVNINKNPKKANIKVLGYKPDNNTKETILEAYGNVTIKQNNGMLEITLDTEEGDIY